MNGTQTEQLQLWVQYEGWRLEGFFRRQEDLDAYVTAMKDYRWREIKVTIVTVLE